MVFKIFSIQILLRLLFLIATIFCLAWSVFVSEMIMLPIFLSILTVLQIIWLFYFLDATNRRLKNFFESVRYSDFNKKFDVNDNSSHSKLNKVMNDVVEDFNKIREAKEEQYHFLQNIIQHIGISMIAFKSDGTIEMINNAAKKLFQLPNPKYIQDIEGFSVELSSCLKKIRNEEKLLIKVQEENDILQLSVYAKEFKISNSIISLVSIQNIQQELEEKELEAWQKLIRVLTHEIMNSITPISSLTTTSLEILNESKNNKENAVCPHLTDSLNDVEMALQTINRRSSGLMHFVETYRNLTKIPKPDFKIFKIADLLIDIHRLFKIEMEERKIDFHMSVHPENLEITADEELIGQVAINLVKNSIHGLEGCSSGKIELLSYLDKRGRITIEVRDNGIGILPDVIDKIFIPFFTTRQSGSGIGLSLSKQIMKLHGGSISVVSTPNVKTAFTLKF